MNRIKKKYKILITGSSGQIGTNLALKLLSEGYDVFGVDCRENTWSNKYPTLLQDLAVIQQNFKGGIGAAQYPKCDLVVHLAANAKVHALVQEPHKAMENINITFNVLEYCRQNSLPIIFSSSREVYGDIHRYITNEEHANFSFTESPYSASKIAGEALIYSYARCYGTKYLVFRFSNVYGRYDNDLERMERVIPLFIDKMSNNLEVTVFGKDKILDFTYVDDCVDGIFLGIKKLLSGIVENETINLAYGEGTNLIEVAKKIQSNLKSKSKINIEQTKQAGEVTHYIADISIAKMLLGYKPSTRIDFGIKKAIEWSKDWNGK